MHSEYGIAIHDGNMVLGRIALREGRRQEAKDYLLKAGSSPGANTLNSFGPNMNLAKDLLQVGERDTMVAYFHECERFWHRQNLKSWEYDAAIGNVPDFGTNLYY